MQTLKTSDWRDCILLLFVCISVLLIFMFLVCAACFFLFTMFEAFSWLHLNVKFYSRLG